MSVLASPIEPVWRFRRWERNPAYWITVADAFAARNNGLKLDGDE